MSRYLLAVVLLTGVYALTLSSVNPWDLGLGALLAVLLLALCRQFLAAEPVQHGPPLHRQLLYLPPLIGRALVAAVQGGWQVLLMLLGLRPLATPRIVKVPVSRCETLEVAISGFVHTLSPDSFLLELDAARNVAVYQVLDNGDLDTLRAELEEFYRRQHALFR